MFLTWKIPLRWFLVKIGQSRQDFSGKEDLTEGE
jgi:hypothetical protein